MFDKWSLVMFLAPLIAAPSASAQFMCPNGSFVLHGPCVMCPNGSFVGAGELCKMQPSGQSQQVPKKAPDKTAVDAGKGKIMCPDGSIVTGTHCVITPYGKFIGQ